MGNWQLAMWEEGKAEDDLFSFKWFLHWITCRTYGASE